VQHVILEYLKQKWPTEDLPALCITDSRLRICELRLKVTVP
jgi:hypothetical protein